MLFIHLLDASDDVELVELIIGAYPADDNHYDSLYFIPLFSPLLSKLTL